PADGHAHRSARQERSDDDAVSDRWAVTGRSLMRRRTRSLSPAGRSAAAWRPAGGTLALAVAFLGAVPSSQAAPPGFSASPDVIWVEVRVQVVKDGAPVRGLSAADFDIYDGRKRQAITGFEVLDAAAPTPDRAAAGPIPVAARRHF